MSPATFQLLAVIGGLVLTALTLLFGIVTFASRTEIDFHKAQLEALKDSDRDCKMRLAILERERDGLQSKVIDLLAKQIMGERGG